MDWNVDEQLPGRWSDDQSTADAIESTPLVQPPLERLHRRRVAWCGAETGARAGLGIRHRTGPRRQGDDRYASRPRSRQLHRSAQAGKACA